MVQFIVEMEHRSPRPPCTPESLYCTIDLSSTSLKLRLEVERKNLEGDKMQIVSSFSTLLSMSTAFLLLLSQRCFIIHSGIFTSVPMLGY